MNCSDTSPPILPNEYLAFKGTWDSINLELTKRESNEFSAAEQVDGQDDKQELGSLIENAASTIEWGTLAARVKESFSGTSEAFRRFQKALNDPEYRRNLAQALEKTPRISELYADPQRRRAVEEAAKNVKKTIRSQQSRRAKEPPNKDSGENDDQDESK
ncbi:hypothetical protein [Mesorhizobium sp. Cs1321R2N1]|uniref:hypothetical protein n=1 Tax=Mesorhizobium sp. Cs1321R2N1 TaxID=3015174 RepID=UPI00301E2446